MPEEKILTQRPDGKSGRSVSKKKYDQMKYAIIKILQTSDLTYGELIDRLTKELQNSFFDNISWYTETIVLDLEAKDIIEKKNTKYHLK